MNRLPRIPALIVVLILLSFTHADADTKDVLKALEAIKASAETGVNYKTYSELVTNLKLEINLLQRTTDDDTEFMKQVKKSYDIYIKCGELWRGKLDMVRYGIRSEDDIILMQDLDKGISQGFVLAAPNLELIYNTLTNKKRTKTYDKGKKQ